MSDTMTDLLWDGARPPARGPRPGLSLDQITAEAIAIADAEGIGALTMPALAKRLGAGTMSLYRYVPGKDELIALMIDRAVGVVPELPGTWREAIQVWALELHRTFFRHRWLLEVVTRPRVMGPRELGWLEAGLAATDGMPLPTEQRFLILLVVNGQVRGVVADQLQEDAQARRPLFTPGMLRSRGREGDFPRLMALMEAIDFGAPPEPGDAEHRMLFGLSLLLDGVESFIRSGRLCEGGLMRVVIAGGHGKIALQLERLLSENGHVPVGLVRDPAQLDDLAEMGAKGVLCDLEKAVPLTVAEFVAGADAVVFAAGAGPGSSMERKNTVDRGASALLGEACGLADVRRFVQISSMGAGTEPPPGTDEVFGAYLRAKTAAEEDLRSRDLDWTIVRPGGLTDDPGTGRVHLGPSVPRGTVPRADVAAVLMSILESPGTAGRTLELVSGDLPISHAVDAVANGT